MTRHPVIALALPLAACGSGGDPPANSVAAVDATITRIRSLTPAQRDGVLLRAVRDAGHDCQQVTSSTSVTADVAGQPAYTAQCDNGGTWVVTFNPGGIATVTSAAAAKGN